MFLKWVCLCLLSLMGRNDSDEYIEEEEMEKNDKAYDFQIIENNDNSVDVPLDDIVGELNEIPASEPEKSRSISIEVKIRFGPVCSEEDETDFDIEDIEDFEDFEDIEV